MNNKSKKESTGCGNMVGFQIPVGFSNRIEELTEFLKNNTNISHTMMEAYLSSLNEGDSGTTHQMLDRRDYSNLAEAVHSYVLAEFIRGKVREVVRKKSGGGGYVLYAPNPNEKHAPNGVGTFPTRLGAKRAELARFPPKDVNKLRRLRKEVDKLLKNPKKAAEHELAAKKRITHNNIVATARPIVKQRESVEILRTVISYLIKESLFHEEKTESIWSNYVERLSPNAMEKDDKFKKYKQIIDKKTHSMLDAAFLAIRKSVNKNVKLKNLGIKKEEDKDRTYLIFSASFDNVSVEPIYIIIKDNIPQIKISDNAKVELTKTDVNNAKLFRAELITAQEYALDKMDDLINAVDSRDKYLEHLENDVDKFVSDLTPLQISLLKQLLVKKYRKI